MCLEKISINIEMDFMNMTYFIWIHKKNERPFITLFFHFKYYKLAK
jgi:hypothetical protein